MLALPGSGREVSQEVWSTLKNLINGATTNEKREIGEQIHGTLNHRNIKVRYLALGLLKEHFPEMLPSEDVLADAMNPFTDKETKDWILTETKQFNPEKFIFLIHGVTPDSLEEVKYGKKDKKDESDDGYRTAFQDPDKFLSYTKIATSLIGIDKNKGISDSRTFSPVGVILNVPRENIRYASKKSYASDGRYIPRIYQDLPNPIEVLTSPDSQGKYNEITIEGTNTVSKRKSEIAGVYIKEGTPKKHRVEAEKFAKAHSIPIIEIPGKWIINPYLVPDEKKDQYFEEIE
jgi:hypothetical protein